MTLEIVKIHRAHGLRPNPELPRRDDEIWEWAQQFKKEPKDFLLNVEEYGRGPEMN